MLPSPENLSQSSLLKLSLHSGYTAKLVISSVGDSGQLGNLTGNRTLAHADVYMFEYETSFR